MIIAGRIGVTKSQRVTEGFGMTATDGKGHAVDVDQVNAVVVGQSNVRPAIKRNTACRRSPFKCITLPVFNVVVPKVEVAVISTSATI